MSRKLLTLISSIGFLLAGCSSQEQSAPKGPPAVPVVATTPEIKDITVYLESIGTVKLSEYVDIRPQVSGKLIEVFIDEGQMVKKGDPLFKIDPLMYEIKVHESEAQFAMDHADLKAVQKKISRYQDLAEKDLVAQTEWDDLKTQLQKAQAVADLDGSRVKFAKVELENCSINSPLDGRVGTFDATAGLQVNAGQATPLVTISKLDPLVVEFHIPEKEFPLLPKDNLSIKIQPLCSHPSSECSEGAVTFLDHQFDPKTGLLLVRGKVNNPDYALRPGQSMKVQVPIEVTQNAKLIPQKAIRYNQQGPYIFVVNDDMTVSVRQLVLGKEEGLDQIVLEGLEPNEKVVLEGHLRLSPGLKVEIKS
jgi:membrane fusion protein, multidrug efflux system